MEISGIRYAIKCHFKTSPIAQSRIPIIHHVMMAGFGNSDIVPAVVDFRRSNFQAMKNIESQVPILLLGEATGFMAIWDALGK